MHRGAAQGVVGRFHPLVEFPPQLLVRLRQLGPTAEVVLLVRVEVVVVEHLLAARLLRPAVLQQILFGRRVVGVGQHQVEQRNHGVEDATGGKVGGAAGGQKDGVTDVQGPLQTVIGEGKDKSVALQTGRGQGGENGAEGGVHLPGAALVSGGHGAQGRGIGKGPRRG